MKNSHIDLVSRITSFLEENYKGSRKGVKSTSNSGFAHLSIDLETIQKKDIPKGMLIQYGVHDTPYGEWLIALSSGKIITIAFLRGNFADQLQNLSNHWNHAKLAEDTTVTGAIVKTMFDHTKMGKLTVLVFGTPFQISVWKTLLEVQEGSVVSYGDVAQAIGRPRAVRAVGTAIGANPIAFLIPCHRVVTGGGYIGQFAGGTDLKISLL